VPLILFLHHLQCLDFLTFLNPNLIGIYTFVTCNTLHKNNNSILCNSYKLNGYLLSLAGNWSNSDKQREEMITYKRSDIEIIENQLKI
jgi:histidinol phosphatase-like enzyme